MKIINRGTYKAPSSQVTCECEAVLEVEDSEWKDGDYGSERLIRCPVCKSTITKPGTEYQGDF